LGHAGNGGNGGSAGIGGQGGAEEHASELQSQRGVGEAGC
jgi:hypothetical protein